VINDTPVYPAGGQSPSHTIQLLYPYKGAETEKKASCRMVRRRVAKKSSSEASVEVHVPESRFSWLWPIKPAAGSTNAHAYSRYTVLSTVRRTTILSLTSIGSDRYGKCTVRDHGLHVWPVAPRQPVPPASLPSSLTQMQNTFASTLLHWR